MTRSICLCLRTAICDATTRSFPSTYCINSRISDMGMPGICGLRVLSCLLRSLCRLFNRFSSRTALFISMTYGSGFTFYGTLRLYIVVSFYNLLKNYATAGSLYSFFLSRPKRLRRLAYTAYVIDYNTYILYLFTK